MKDFQLITKKIMLEFGDDDLAINKIDLDAIEATLDPGTKLNRKPVMLKHKDDHILVSFTVSREGTKVGFGA